MPARLAVIEPALVIPVSKLATLLTTMPPPEVAVMVPV